MLIPIENRCKLSYTRGFVAPETVDALGEKMAAIIANRRMTLSRRYLGDRPGVPEMRAGLRVRTGIDGPTTARPRESFSVHLTGEHWLSDRVLALNTHWDALNESQAKRCYDHPEEEWLGQRRDITLVELKGYPGSPRRDDSVRIEHWNEHGVGQETLVVFDDLDLIQEIAWTVKKDPERSAYLDTDFCTAHGVHFEDPGHAYQPSLCVSRTASLAENLDLLAHLARANNRPEQ